jgi:hypothetical protein
MPAVADDRIIEGYTLGVFQSNTYILAARSGDTAVVIDPGQEASRVVSERMEALGLRTASSKPCSLRTVTSTTSGTRKRWPTLPGSPPTSTPATCTC